ncbi:MAG: thiamine pyrophosphate-binding protein [Burkholderiales bacterium]
MKGSDYVALFLKSKMDFCFGLQGGAVVHLFDSCERIGPKPIYCHHEQAAAFAASAYARVHGYGACIVTTGPGGTNAITGLLGAWQDSIPCLFISGQTRAQFTSYGKPVRQVGAQEAPIVDIVRPLTKLARFVEQGSALKAALDEAYEASMSGRPGPAWIDLPLDIQWSEML